MVNIAGNISRVLQYLADALRNLLYRELKDLLSVHSHISKLRFSSQKEISIGTGAAGKHFTLCTV